MSKLLKSFLTGTVLTFGLAIAGAGQASAVDMKTLLPQTITMDCSMEMQVATL